MNTKLDDYFASLEIGDNPAKPKPVLTKYWEDVIAKMEERKFNGWSVAATAFLEVAFDQQEEIRTKILLTAENYSNNRDDSTVDT